MTYYHSPAWRALRALALRRDDYTCTVPGCGQPAAVVDHIVSRKDGGTDTLLNLRSLCTFHNWQIIERLGKRKNSGQPTVKGVDANGRPLDPNHHWNK